MDATTVAVDLAKDVFEVALANRAGRIIERRRLTRRQFVRLNDTLAPATELVMRRAATLTTGAVGLRREVLMCGSCRRSTFDPMYVATRPIGRTRQRYWRRFAVATSDRYPSRPLSSRRSRRSIACDVTGRPTARPA